MNVSAAPASRRRLPILAALLLAGALAGCNEKAADGAGAAAGDFSGDLTALGTEPFWTVNIRSDRLTFSRPDAADVVGTNAGPKIADGAATWNAPDATTPFMLTLTKEDCSDQMSDRHYPFKAVLTFDETTLTGCATTPAALASKPAP